MLYWFDFRSQRIKKHNHDIKMVICSKKIQYKKEKKIKKVFYLSEQCDEYLQY